jgi:hypothetical protein
MEHDHAYKLLLLRPELIADLLRDFVGEPWVVRPKPTIPGR